MAKRYTQMRQMHERVQHLVYMRLTFVKVCRFNKTISLRARYRKVMYAELRKMWSYYVPLKPSTAPRSMRSYQKKKPYYLMYRRR